MYMTDKEIDYFDKNINRLKYYKNKAGMRKYYIKN